MLGQAKGRDDGMQDAWLSCCQLDREDAFVDRNNMHAATIAVATTVKTLYAIMSHVEVS